MSDPDKVQRCGGSGRIPNPAAAVALSPDRWLPCPGCPDCAPCEWCEGDGMLGRMAGPADACPRCHGTGVEPPAPQVCPTCGSDDPEKPRRRGNVDRGEVGYYAPCPDPFHTPDRPPEQERELLPRKRICVNCDRWGYREEWPCPECGAPAPAAADQGPIDEELFADLQHAYKAAEAEVTSLRSKLDAAIARGKEDLEIAVDVQEQYQARFEEAEAKLDAAIAERDDRLKESLAAQHQYQNAAKRADAAEAERDAAIAEKDEAHRKWRENEDYWRAENQRLGERSLRHFGRAVAAEAQLRDREQAIRDAADWMEYEAADSDPEHDAHTAHSEAFHACARKARSALASPESLTQADG